MPTHNALLHITHVHKTQILLKPRSISPAANMFEADMQHGHYNDVGDLVGSFVVSDQSSCGLSMCNMRSGRRISEYVHTNND